MLYDKEIAISAIAIASNYAVTDSLDRGTIRSSKDSTNVFDSSYLLEDHIFCALISSFASCTLSEEKRKEKATYKFVDCSSESKTSSSGKEKLVKESLESIPVVPSKKRADSRKTSRASTRASIKRINRKSKLSRDSKHEHSKTTPEETEPEDADTKTEIPKDLPNEHPFDSIYLVTGESHNLIKSLKDGITFDFLNGNTYQGIICFESKDGMGVYYWADGSKYKGKFTGDLPHGEGCMEWADESKYEGYFEKGLRNGSGSYTLRPTRINRTFTGYWSNGLQTGKGTLKISEKSWYEGDFVDGLYNGRGMRQYPSGGKYLGEWKNGKQNGQGIMLYSNNDMYIGDWIDGKMDGTGKYIWDTFLNTQFVYPMHNTYMGQWKDGKRNGTGSLILSTGAVISTLWVNNVKHGWGRLLCTNGTTIETNPLFVNDTLVSMKQAYYKDDDSPELFEDYYPDYRMSAWQARHMNCILEPYKSCTSPINIPPYFMNINCHLNKFFDLDNWFKRIRNINWCIWLSDMPPGYDAQKVPSNFDKMYEVTTQQTANKPYDKTEKPTIDESVDFKGKPDKGKSTDDGSHQPHKSRCIKYIIPKRRKSSVARQIIIKLAHSKSIINSSLKSNSLLRIASLKGKFNEDEEVSEELQQEIYIYEKKWLRNRIILHMPTLQKLYNRYSTICCKEKPQFETGLLRVLLWKLLKDINYGETGFSIAELDHMAVGNTDPFDFVSVSEMIHYLLIISWELYTKHDKVNTNVPGMNGGGFDLFMIERIIPLTSKEETYEPLFPNCETIPIEALYKLFLSLGPNVTIKHLVRRLTRKVDKHYDRHIISHLPPPNEFYRHSLKGQNGILPGGEIIYKASKLPDFEYIEQEFRKPPDTVRAVDLDFFGNLGADSLIDTIVKCFPYVTNSRGEILNQNYPVSFLEFLEVLSECINVYLVKMMKITGDMFDSNRLKTIEKCLDELVEEIQIKNDLEKNQMDKENVNK